MTEPTIPPPAHEATLEEAAIAYAAAKKAVDRYAGEKRGAEYAALLAAWRGATFELQAAATRLAKTKEPA